MYWIQSQRSAQDILFLVIKRKKIIAGPREARNPKFCSATKHDQNAKNVSIITLCHIWDRSFRHKYRRMFFADVIMASSEDFERADVVEASYENFENFKRNWVCCGLFFKFSYIYIEYWLLLWVVKSSGNHFHFLKEPFDMFRFTITELKYRTLCRRCPIYLKA